MKPSTILKKARKLVERGWCKGPYAKNKNGAPVDPLSKTACKWCLDGALQRATNRSSEWGVAYQVIKRANGIVSPIGFNEQQKDKRPVLRAFDRAIKLAISEGQ